MSKKKEDGGNINRKYKEKRFNVRKLGKYRQKYRVRSKFKCSAREGLGTVLHIPPDEYGTVYILTYKATTHNTVF